MTLVIVLGAVFTLLCPLALLDYRRICRRDRALRAALPEPHLGKTRLP